MLLELFNKMSTLARITTFSGGEWLEIHEKKNRYLPVTKLIQFLGWGYESRNQLFSTVKKEKNDYLEKAMAHGNKYEAKALSFFGDALLPIPQHPDKISCVFNEQLIGTVDAYLRDLEDRLIIIEIKCPFGQGYGKFQEELIDVEFEKKVNNWKHWLQIQFYLHMHKEFGIKYGYLCYYYKKGTGTEDGQEVFIMNKIKYDKTLWEDMKIQENIDLYFKKKDEVPYKSERVKKSKLLTEERITRGIVQRCKLLR